MIASWRGLAVAAAIAVALVVAVIIDAAGRPEAVDRALVPGFDPAHATELLWERPGQPAIRAERAGDGWRLGGAGDAHAVPADAGSIGEVLAALRGARWHRRGEAPAPHATLTVTVGGARHVLGIAAPIAGTEQGWIVDDGRGVVVDSWVARALDRDRLGLQVRRPLGEVASARSIRITGWIAGPITGPVPGIAPGTPPGVAPGTPPGTVPADGAGLDVELTGAPRRLLRPSPLIPAPGLAAALERALRDVAIVRIPDGPVAGHGLAIALEGRGAAAGAALELGGDCPGAPELVAASGSAGSGCVERAAAAAIQAAAGALQQPPAAIVERRPVPFEPARVVLADGAVLDTSPPRIGDAAVDPTRIAELFAALAAPAEVARVPAGPPTGHVVARVPAGSPIGHIVVANRAGESIALDLFADRVAVRRGEPVALRLAPGAWGALMRPSRELRDLALWLEEPTSVTALVIDGTRYERGAVIGAWTRRSVPLDAAEAARVEALVVVLAAPRALGFVDRPIAVIRRVAIEVAPPVGAAIHHEIDIAAPGAGAAGCPARTGHDTVQLPAAICAEVAALAARK